MWQGPLHVYEFGPFRFDPESGTLHKSGQAVELGPQAAAVLLVLLREPGRVISKERLALQAWDGVAVTDNALTYQIHLIRTALGAEGEHVVETLPRRGYRLAVSVRRVPAESGLGSTDSASNPPPSGHLRVSAEPPRDALGSTSSGAPPPRRSLVLTSFAAGLLAALVGVVALSKPVTEELRVVQYTTLTHDGLQKTHTLMADDQYVYYSNGVGASVRVPAVGGESDRVFDQPLEFDLQDRNSETSAYLARRDGRSGPDSGDLWNLPVRAIPRQLGSARCDQSRWSRDASQIVCAVGLDLSVLKNDGARIRGLPTPRTGAVGNPSWSPDGRRVRFDVPASGDGTRATYSIWEVNVDGTGLHKVLPRGPDLEDVCCGAWAPDGSAFVFQARREGQTELWVTDERRRLFEWRPADPVQLTVGPTGFEYPVMSRDGRTVFAIGTPVLGEMMRFDVTSHGFVQYLEGLSATWVAFSPDHASLIYVSYPDNALWRSRADGSQRRRLTASAPEADSVTWSPDGSRIVFRSRMASTHMKIYVMPADGGDAVPITSDDVEQGFATWSADGSRLVFGDVPPRWEHPLGTESLHIYALATHAVTTIPGSAGLWTARWSPDGRYIAALTIMGQQLRIYDTRDSTWRPIPVEHLENPVWSHDSRFIYGASVSPEPQRIRRVNLSTGAVETVVDLVNYPLAFPAWFGLTPDDSVLVLHRRGGPEVYALTLGRR